MKEETAVALMQMATDLTLASLNKTHIDTKYGSAIDVSEMTARMFNNCAKTVVNNYSDYFRAAKASAKTEKK
jgi:hypothetical protein